MSEIELIFDCLKSACCPEDVFGTGSEPKIVFRKLARACHPDSHPHEALAGEAFMLLTSLNEEANKRIEDGVWGKRLPLPHCLPLEIGRYQVKRAPRIGELADLYEVAGKPLLVKVARSHDDNDLLRAEAAALHILKQIPPPVSEGVAALAENFQLEAAAGNPWKREANVIADLPGFVTAEEVHRKTIVDARTVVWIFKRILTLLTWVHHFGLVHGAILPPHVLLYPDNDGKNERDARKHSVRLVDWCYSVDFKTRTRLSAWVPAWKEHYAPELLSKKAIGPAADLYMAAFLMRYLTKDLPRSLETVLVRCVDKDPQKRYQKAAEVFEAWSKAAIAEFGSPRWQAFNLPK